MFIKALLLAFSLLLPKKKKQSILKEEADIRCPYCYAQGYQITEQGLCESCGNKIK